MNIVRALIGVDRLQVHGVAHDVQLAGDSGPAVHVAGFAGDGQGLAAVVALHHRDGLGDPGALIQQPTQRQRAFEAEERYNDWHARNSGLRNAAEIDFGSLREEIACRLQTIRDCCEGEG